MKRFIYFVFFALSVFALSTGCSDSDTEDPTPTVTVTFDSQGGSAVAPVTVEQGSKIAKPTDPTKEGVLFVGWFKEQAGTTAWNFDTDVVDRNITLYAKWTTESFTVTFNTNGGSAIAPVQVASGGTVTKPTDPTKEGFTLESWSNDAALTAVYNFSTPVTADLTLYAKWAAAVDDSRAKLEALMEEAAAIDLLGYTEESIAALNTKMDAADKVLDNQNATTAELTTAYNELKAAIDALVEKPASPVKSLKILQVTPIGGAVLIQANSTLDVEVYACDASGEPYQANPAVTFTYNEAEFEAMADGEIFINDNLFGFDTKETLTAGLMATLTITSKDNPLISQTLTIRTAAEGEIAQTFINLVNTLPAPEDITHACIETIKLATNFAQNLPEDAWANEEVVIAAQKLQECKDAATKLPKRLQFSAFTGNICSMTQLYMDGDIAMGDFTYKADGNFPAGVYTQVGVISDELYAFQYRYTLKADGTGIRESRMIDDPITMTGGEFSLDETITHYTVEGTQADGGMFYITSEWGIM